MTDVLLDEPYTLNPIQATKFVIKNTSIDHLESGKSITVGYELLDENDVFLEYRQTTINTTEVQTFINDIEDDIIEHLLTELGITGTADNGP